MNRNKRASRVINVRAAGTVKRVKLVKHVSVKRTPVVPISPHVKHVETIEAVPKKTTSLRTELGDGCYMVTYYYRRGQYGELLAEDVNYATHFERAVYDSMNHLLGTTNGELGDKIAW